MCPPLVPSPHCFGHTIVLVPPLAAACVVSAVATRCQVVGRHRPSLARMGYAEAVLSVSTGCEMMFIGLADATP